jgi:hypothetical protein
VLIITGRGVGSGLCQLAGFSQQQAGLSQSTKRGSLCDSGVARLALPLTAAPALAAF